MPPRKKKDKYKEIKAPKGYVFGKTTGRSGATEVQITWKPKPKRRKKK